MSWHLPGRLLIAGQKIDRAFCLCKILSCDMKIDGCCFCYRMTQKMLDVIQIGAGSEQMGCEAMPQGVLRSLFLDAGLMEGFF